MNLQIIRILNVFIAALLGGALFGSWMGYNPEGLSAGAYLEQQQQAIKSLNTLMPAMGLITIILTLIAAFYQRKQSLRLILLLVAASLLIISALITKFGNQPINAIVITWEKNDMPDEWTSLRDKWWSLHILRCLASITALLLIVIASVRRSPQVS
jgi:uncharacterized membrane protein